MINEESDEEDITDTCDCDDYRFCAKYLTGKCIRDYTAHKRIDKESPREIDGHLDWGIEIDDDWFDL